MIPAWVAGHAEAPRREPFDLAALGPVPVRLGGPGLIWRGEALLDDESVLPPYVRREAGRDDCALLHGLAALPVRREGRKALVFHGWGVRVYGHLLIEMLPKLLLAARFASLFAGAAPVLDRQMPDWFVAILRAHLGIDPARAIWFDSGQERLALDQAIILPLLGREGGYHPVTGPLFDDFVARVGQPPAQPMPRVFVARGDFANPAAPLRWLDNEAELAAIAADEFGFTVVRPEQLPFAAQVGLFAQAAAIVGQMGSGLHNAIFAPPGCVNGVIRLHGFDQSAIAAMRGQRIGFLGEGIRMVTPGHYLVEADRFRRFLDRLLPS